MDVVLILAALLSIVVFLQKFCRPRGDLHKIPGPPSLPIFGYPPIYRVTAYNIIPFVHNLAKQYGGIFVLWAGWIPTVHVTNPDAVEDILRNRRNIRKGRSYKFLQPWLGRGLLTSEGSRWFSHRRLITPTFHFSILESYIEIFQLNSQTLVDRIFDVTKNGEPIELYPFVSRCTLDIICEAAMGTKINCQRKPRSSLTDDDLYTTRYINAIVRISEMTTDRILNLIQRYNPLFGMTAAGREYSETVKIVHQFTEGVIRSRRKAALENPRGSPRHQAFLDLLLDAMDNEGNCLSDQDIREEVDTFMFEGHDTTSASILWTTYLLATHPIIQDGVVSELTDIFGSNSTRPISKYDLKSMKYLDRCIREALRLYPSVPNIIRYVDEPMLIGGYTVPVSTAVMVHIHELHRDPLIYPNPEMFDPDRFLPENVANRNPFAYIPFSAGFRNCIGQKFAMMEEKIVLSRLLMNYKIRFSGRLDTSKIKSELILRPPNGMRFLLEKR